MSSSDYDIVLLDILMPGMTGMKAAHEIRGVDTEVKIVFLTSSPEFAVESYAVKSYDYILKPSQAWPAFCSPGWPLWRS